MKKSDAIALERELRPILEDELDKAEILKAMAKVCRDKGGDWSQFKKLVKAKIEDSRDGTDKRVTAIIAKADFAAAYADMLGFGTKMNNNGKSCSSENKPAATEKPAERLDPEPASHSNLREQLTASLAMADAGPIPQIILDARARGTGA